MDGQIEEMGDAPADFDPDVEDEMEYTVEEILDCRINMKEKDPGNRNRKGVGCGRTGQT